jgi:hypothetical protein
MTDRNETILNERMELLDKRKGIRVGDFLKLSTGKYLRFSHDWGDDIQTSKGGSFYLGRGYCEFSGGLYGAIDKIDLKEIPETRNGQVWFFRNNQARAHNGIYFDAPFRVFEFNDLEKEKSYIKKENLGENE